MIMLHKIYIHTSIAMIWNPNNHTGISLLTNIYNRTGIAMLHKLQIILFVIEKVHKL